MVESAESSPWVLDADEATFQQQVVERSREILVVIDFWAAWCQPCQLLGPVLEKVARDSDGKFLLVKADVEKLQNIAAGFGVQSIPAVFALRDGQLLDYFVGLKSEEQFRAWIERLLPSPAETLVSEARALEATDPVAANAKYAEAEKLDPNLFSAQIGRASLAFAQGNKDDARAILELLEKRGYLEPEAEKLKAQLDVQGQAGSTADLAALRAAAEANPQDLTGRLQLAEALAGSGDYEEALEAALLVVQSAKKEFVEPARKLMVDVFKLLPDDSPLVTDYRRRLSTALY